MAAAASSLHSAARFSAASASDRTCFTRSSAASAAFPGTFRDENLVVAYSVHLSEPEGSELFRRCHQLHWPSRAEVKRFYPCSVGFVQIFVAGSSSTFHFDEIANQDPFR